MTDSVQFSQALRHWMDVFMHRSMSGWMQYVKASGLSMPQFSILMRLHYRGGCGISNIGEHMDISAAAASQLVEKLVQAGLLERSEDPHDRRAKQVALSSKGEELIEQGIQERYRWVDGLAETLNPEEKSKITEALDIMTQVAQTMESKA